MGSDECFSADVVDQGERLEEAHLAGDCLLEGARDHFLDGEVEDVDGGEAGEDDPVELFEQVGVWTAGKDETSVCIPDEHHSPDEAEDEGVEVSHHNHVPREGEQLTPTTEVKKWESAILCENGFELLLCSILSYCVYKCVSNVSTNVSQISYLGE